jgi:hypothetical protein
MREKNDSETIRCQRPNDCSFINKFINKYYVLCFFENETKVPEDGVSIIKCTCISLGDVGIFLVP